MSDNEERVTELRKELGNKAAKKGDALHDSASREFAEGYRRGALGFGGNVIPKNFGKGNGADTGWTCVCGHHNTPERRWMKGGEELCWNCGVQREYSEEK